jgi:hypothetical protein
LARLPRRSTPGSLGSPLGSPRRARGRCSSPTSATSLRHVHPRSFGSRVTRAYALVDHDALRTRRSQLAAMPARLAATRPRVRCA